MFKVNNNKDTKTTSMTLKIFPTFCVSAVDFKQVYIWSDDQ